MYFRKKTSGGRAYLQIVESRRDGAQVRQQVIATLGRIEDLRDSGQLERLLRSGARFAAKAIVVNAVAEGAVTASAARRIGPALVFERLWEETGCRQVIEDLAGSRKHGFPLERAVFLTVLHRLFAGGSDRAADRWREDYAIDGAADIDLHHLYRAMAWLGEELSEDQQDGATLFAPRCLKDVIEEELFARRRNLFSKLDLVFMDTTSLYFEGAGGQTLGQRGFSKDPVCTEMWPGNTADVGSLVPVVMLAGRHYIVCRNREEMKKDAAARTAILAALERQLKKGDKTLVGNKGYRRFLATPDDDHFVIDRAKAEEDAKFDGIFVLRTNADLSPLETMLCYKHLWMVERAFRTSKSLFATRPIFHKLDETIRGHVSCSFLALVLKKELEDRIATLGHASSWPNVLADLDSLTETEVEQDGKRFLLRTPPRPAASLALRAAGVALPPTVRQLADA